MDTAINDFVRVLREHRIRVSPAESVDAMLALRQVGLRSRAGVRDALRASLIKNVDDVETFERLFDLFFSLRGVAAPEPAAVHVHDHEHDHAAPGALELGEDAEGDEDDTADHMQNEDGPTDLRRYFDEDDMQPAQSMHQDPDRMRLSMLSQQLILNRDQGPLQNALQRLSHQLKVRRVRGMFHPGGLVPHAGSGREELPLDISAVEMRNLVDHLHDLGVDDDLVREVEARGEDILRGLPELIEKLIARQNALDSERRQAQAPESASLRTLTDFSPAEQKEMEAAVRRLARQIHGARTRRLRKDRAGNISVAHTLRHNIRYEGIPFEPVLRNHREQRPRLVLLCDISLSTRNLARFWLHLVYRTQSLFSKVRTFVFVADVAEVTQLFEENPMERAVEAVFGGKVIDADVTSDFGSAAERFRTEFLPTINRRTTVVVLGDGRNNGKDPNLPALEEITTYARKTIWITPEPKWGWPMGGCDMDLYEPLCDRVEVVRTVDQLGKVAENLVGLHR